MFHTFSDVFLSCSQPEDTAAHGLVFSEFTSRTLPPGIKGVKVSFHFICGKLTCQVFFILSKNIVIAGGDDVSQCNLSVDLIQRSPTQYLRCHKLFDN